MATRIVLLTVGLIVVAAIGYFASGLVQNYRRGHAFAAITVGMSEGEVVKRLGNPNLRRKGCRDTPSWFGAPVVEEHCNFELQYDLRFEPAFWTVGFNERARVIAKYEYVSP